MQKSLSPPAPQLLHGEAAVDMGSSGHWVKKCRGRHLAEGLVGWGWLLLGGR